MAVTLNSNIIQNTTNTNAIKKEEPSQINSNNKPVEGKKSSNTKYLALGATALATIVIGGLLTKGKLWGKPKINKEEVSSITNNMPELKIPDSVKEVLNNNINVETKYLKHNGKTTITYRNNDNSKTIFIFDKDGNYTNRLELNMTSNSGLGGYKLYFADGAVQKQCWKCTSIDGRNIEIDTKTFSNEYIYQDPTLPHIPKKTTHTIINKDKNKTVSVLNKENVNSNDKGRLLDRKTIDTTPEGKEVVRSTIFHKNNSGSLRRNMVKDENGKKITYYKNGEMVNELDDKDSTILRNATESLCN